MPHLAERVPYGGRLSCREREERKWRPAGVFCVRKRGGGACIGVSSNFVFLSQQVPPIRFARAEEEDLRRMAELTISARMSRRDWDK